MLGFSQACEPARNKSRVDFCTMLDVSIKVTDYDRIELAALNFAFSDVGRVRKKSTKKGAAAPSCSNAWNDQAKANTGKPNGLLALSSDFAC